MNFLLIGVSIFLILQIPEMFDLSVARKVNFLLNKFILQSLFGEIYILNN